MITMADSKARVKINNNLSDSFVITTGVEQDDQIYTAPPEALPRDQDEGARQK